jgi:hypothetical protein
VNQEKEGRIMNKILIMDEEIRKPSTEVLSRETSHAR